MQIESALSDVARAPSVSAFAPVVPAADQEESAGLTARSDSETGGAFGQVVSTIGAPLSSDAVTALQQAPASQDQPPGTLPPPGEADPTRAGVSAFAPPPPPPPEEQAAQTDEDDVAAEEEEEEQPTEGDEEGLDGLTPEEEAVVQDLRQRDAEVRRHEQAHAAAGGQYAGAPTYEYERGPDGALYAVGGEVRIDTSPIPGNAEATIAKMQTVRRAALAPAEPSPQDQRVAALAQREISAARADLREEQAAERASAEEARESERGTPDATSAPDTPGSATPIGPQPPQTVQAILQVGGVVDTNPIDVSTVTSITAGLSSPPPVDSSASQGLRATQAFQQAQSLASPTERATVFA